eukprot:GDKJ01020282.1.p1 GENE.GDKJ01020282.1~~GDKJ01020282.1.p1  ORF type:complete len:406 (-),score=76.56 GDKJ01020282.1:539-1756(-)
MDEAKRRRTLEIKDEIKNELDSLSNIKTEVSSDIKQSFSKDTAIHIFTRDFHLDDNRCFSHINCDVVPIFIFTHQQIEDNKFFSPFCYNFMVDCLLDLRKQIRGKGGELYFFKGDLETVMKQVIDHVKPSVVSIAKDYTEFAASRENALREICGDRLIVTDNHMLLTQGEHVNKQGTIFKVFTPFHTAAKTLKYEAIDTPVTFKKHDFETTYEPQYIKDTPSRYIRGGLANCIKYLDRAKVQYEKKDELDETLLSPFIKFNVMSPRKIYNYISAPDYRRNLFWREFYYNRDKEPGTVVDNNTWEKTPEYQNFVNAKTPHELINLIVSELKQTGYINNRKRLVCSNYFVNYVKVHWQLGEAFFAKYLIDYDPVINKYGWHWNFKNGVKMSIEIQTKKMLSKMKKLK